MFIHGFVVYKRVRGIMLVWKWRTVTYMQEKHTHMYVSSDAKIRCGRKDTRGAQSTTLCQKLNQGVQAGHGVITLAR